MCKAKCGGEAMRPFFKSLIWFVAVLVYLAIGGAVFSAIEKKEAVLPVNYPDLQASLAATYNLSNATIDKLFQEFRRAEEQQAASQLPDWDVFNSAMFSLTIITTIGYGVMSPTTTLSRALTILYALLGIPLFGVLITSIGDIINKSHSVIMGRLFGKDRRHEHTQNLVCSGVLMLKLLLISGAVYTTNTPWTFFESFYYSFITLSTIGFGDFTYYLEADLPDNKGLNVIMLITYMLVTFAGLALVGSVLSGIPDALKEFKQAHSVGTGNDNDGKNTNNNQQDELYENCYSLNPVPS